MPFLLHHIRILQTAALSGRRSLGGPSHEAISFNANGKAPYCRKN